MFQKKCPTDKWVTQNVVELGDCSDILEIIARKDQWVFVHSSSIQWSYENINWIGIHGSYRKIC